MALIDNFGTCTSDFLASAVDQCSINSYGDLRGIGLLRPGTKIEEANLTPRSGWDELIKDSVYFPYLNMWNFEQTTPENETATSSTGNIRSIRNGKPQYTITYDGNPCTVKSLHDKKGLVWDIIFIFDKGVLVKQNADGTISGFQASYFDVGTLSLQQATDIQSVSVMFQLDSAHDFNSNFGFITNESLGFDLLTVKGAYSAKLEANVYDGTSVEVTAVSACNSALNYTGLEDASNWKVNGVTPTTVTYNATTGAYTLTVLVPPVGGLATIVLAGEDALGNIYTGKVSTTVSA